MRAEGREGGGDAIGDGGVVDLLHRAIDREEFGLGRRWRGRGLEGLGRGVGKAWYALVVVDLALEMDGGAGLKGAIKAAIGEVKPEAFKALIVDVEEEFKGAATPFGGDADDGAKGLYPFGAIGGDLRASNEAIGRSIGSGDEEQQVELVLDAPLLEASGGLGADSSQVGERCGVGIVEAQREATGDIGGIERHRSLSGLAGMAVGWRSGRTASLGRI